jgi:hypothetical protein
MKMKVVFWADILVEEMMMIGEGWIKGWGGRKWCI